MKINLRNILEHVRISIIKRTKSGKDIELNSFKQYTSKYIKKKKSTKVDLTLTGHMLNSLNINESQIYLNNKFAQDKAKGNAKNGRQFMGLSQQQHKLIQKQITPQIEKSWNKEVLKWKIR